MSLGQVASMPFQSTLPVRGATLDMLCEPFLRHISIHAPREGSDFTPPVCAFNAVYFNPRSP